MITTVKLLVTSKALLLAIACLGGLLGASDVAAQPVLQRFEINGNALIGNDLRIQIQGRGGLGEDSEAAEVGGAMLKTDPDLEALLEKANNHAEDGNFRVATRLWQAVLERSGDSLYTEDKVVYFSISDQIEQILAQLPAEALEIYRVTADASARQILTEANDPNHIESLMRVTSNFFVSSEGDDAAFRLGCLYLDRHDFSGALRLFQRIATQHPDPSMPLDEVYARIAICHAMMGNPAMATKSINDGRGFGADSQAIDAVDRSLESLSPTKTKDAVAEQWSTIHGNTKRLAAMPALPESAFSGDQFAVWQFFVPPRTESYAREVDTIGKVLVGSDYEIETRDSLERQMIKEWKRNDWRPAGHLLFDKQRIYFKAPADLISFDRQRINQAIASVDQEGADAKTNREEPQPSDFANWRSIWRNLYQVDQATELFERRIAARHRMRSRQQKGSGQSELALVPRQLHFGDRIHQQFSMQNGIVYSIEGKSFDKKNRHAISRGSNHWSAQFRRVRSNFLSAYEADTGRMLWRLPRVNQPDSPSYDPGVEEAADAEDAEQLWLSSGGMMAAPIAFGDLLILPVNQNGAIYVYGVDPQDEGRTVWSSFLCDEPEAGSVASAPVNLTIDGSDLFVTCGTGVMFAIDPTTGKVRFAKRYSRVGQENQLLRAPYNSKRIDFDGWSSDTIIPNGRELICFCSDASTIFAIDRNDGSLVWKTELKPYGLKVDYIAGAWGDLLYLGGQQTIIAIDLSAQGKLAWGGEDLFEGQASNGRAMVTPQGVFVPVENAIWRFALNDKHGKVLDQVEVFLGTDAPVGNLYSDGERIWVHGASRLYALAPRED